MLGSDFVTAVTSLLNGDTIDITLFYQYLNTARITREMQRPFMKLRKLATPFNVSSVTSQPLDPTLVTGYSLPSDFQYLSRDGEITLYNNNLQWQQYTEIPFDQQVYYLQNNNNFWIDHNQSKIFFTGIIDQLYKAYLFYQADLGDISANTTWVNIPSRFHMILAYDVAAMYRLGQDYDDISARNANENVRRADMLFETMKTWDDNLQRSAVTRMDYPLQGEAPGFTNHKIPMS